MSDKKKPIKLNKSKLAKDLKVSRPTLDRMLKKSIFNGVTISDINFSQVLLYFEQQAEKKPTELNNYNVTIKVFEKVGGDNPSEKEKLINEVVEAINFNLLLLVEMRKKAIVKNEINFPINAEIDKKERLLMNLRTQLYNFSGTDEGTDFLGGILD